MLLIKNSGFIEQEGIVIKDLLIQNGHIDSIKPNLHIPEAEIFDADGKIILPGFVCSHHHIYSALSRGITAYIPASENFVSILKNLWWRLDCALDEEAIYYSAITACYEAVRNGTTSIIDHHASPSFINGSLDIISNVMDEFGLRGILSYEITNRNGIVDAHKGIEENFAFTVRNQNNVMKRGAIGFHAPFTVNDDIFSEVSERIKDVQTGIHIHVSEDAFDSAFSSFSYSCSPVKRLENFHLLNDKSLIVHGVHLSSDEIEILNEHDCFLLHNPRSNMNNNVGYAKNLDQVKNVALGTDGIGCDMLEELKFALFKANDSGRKNTWNKPLDYLLKGNAILERYFGEKFGQVKEGYAADLILLDYTSPTPLSSANLLGHLYFGISSSNVDSVIVNGKIIMKNRQLSPKLNHLLQGSADCAAKLWNRINSII